MTDTSGRLFEMPWAVWDHDSSSWRTYAGTSHSGSRRFSGTWPTSGSMRDGACFEHPTWGHPTSAPASLLLPTPNTMDGMAERSDEALARARTKDGCSNLKDVIPRLPTPSANDWKGANRNPNMATGRPPASAHSLATKIDQLLPTPTARDHKDGRECDVPENALLGRVVWSIGDRTDPPSNDGKPSTDPHQPPLPTEG